MRKSSGVAVLAVAVVIAVLAVNAVRLRSRQVETAQNNEVPPPAAAAAQRLAQAVRFRTISAQQASSFAGAEFDHFRAFSRHVTRAWHRRCANASSTRTACCTNGPAPILH